MKSSDFLAAHPVFTYDEFAGHTGGRKPNPHTTRNRMAALVASGRVLRVRRGLFASVPAGVDPGRAPVDPYLVASKVSQDTAVAYHAALQFHGRAYSLWHRFHYFTPHRTRAFTFRDHQFVPVLAPKAIRDRSDLGGGVALIPHAGGTARVTTLERAMVDVLDAPDKGGGWEEIWRSLEAVEFFDIDKVIEYVAALGSGLTAARVGFFLEQHRAVLMVEEKHFERLARYAPREPRYLDSSRRPGKFFARWNLVVPDYVVHRRWEEAA
jgi:predicted transcriptional regulator of viral defense system